LSGDIDNQNNRIWSAEKLHALHSCPLHLIKIGDWSTVSQKQIMGPLFKYFHSVYCWKRINGIAGFSNLRWPPILWKQQQPSCGTSSVITLSGMVFGLHDPQTLCNLTSFCEDFLKKDSTAATKEAWRTLNVTLNRLSLALPF